MSPSEWAEKIASTVNCSESFVGDWVGRRTGFPVLGVVEGEQG